MDDLNDYLYFAQVVDHGGFAAAGRALNLPKSTLSRRISQLEERLGVRLLQRSTRHFSVTDLGREFYQHCVAMQVEAECARDVIARHQGEPQGIVRMSCPITLLHYNIAELISQFMVRHPKIVVQLEATNRRVDVLAEGLDLALRVRFPPLENSNLVMRVLCESPQRLLASPDLLTRHPPIRQPEYLQGLPSMDWGTVGEHVWCLESVNGESRLIRHQPRLVTEDMTALRIAAMHGLGVVQLPTIIARQALDAGELCEVLPDWAPRSGIVHAVFPSRRGLLPSVRLLLDYLVANIRH
ncbi:LysR substrate-binding domain-containing protein [Perlucidibaca piscinae]|uniref:LysR substrate-binding domain-containing protein n=1 Tax=Perlucidibaca piscinae TaxID=392589 RepID=UPI0003B457CD|nr:LysR substrate-binding domain-containing protein [Perlucidibaca piscinae]